MNPLKLLPALGLAALCVAASPTANAQSLAVTPNTVVGNTAGGPTTPGTVDLVFTNGATATGGYQADLIFDTAAVTATTITPASPAGHIVTCQTIPGGGPLGEDVIRVVVANLGGGPAVDGVHCTIALEVVAGLADGSSYPLEIIADVNLDDGVTNGVVNITAEGPPTITFDETPLVLPNAAIGDVTSGTVAVTVTDGGGANAGDTASYTCTAPTGFTVSPLAGGPIVNGGTLPPLDVSCTAAAAAVNGNILCTATNTAPSTADFDIPVTCPAGTATAPTLTPTPAPGGTVTLPAGAPGAVSCATISIAATGGAGVDATVTCTSSDPAITVTPAGLLTFAPGSAPQTIQVCATLTDTPLDIAAAVSCTGTHGPGNIDWGYAVAAPAGSTAPTFVPASSLWSKLALFGIFGVLGMLIIGLRRSH